MADDKHDFRGINTTGEIEPAKIHTPQETWTVSGNIHTLLPANEFSVFRVEVTIFTLGFVSRRCVVNLLSKDTDHLRFALAAGSFIVDSMATPAEITEMRRKAKAQAIKFLRRQIILL